MTMVFALQNAAFAENFTGWIVKLDRTHGGERFLKSHRLGGRVLDSRGASRWLHIEGARPGAVTALSASVLATLPGVEHIEADQRVKLLMAPGRPVDETDPASGTPEFTPNDPHFGKLWGLQSVAQSGSIRAPHAWHHVRSRSLATVVVGVLDTGVNYHHEDLKPILWSGKLNGRTMRGIDAIQKDDVADDQNGHGSHVSGTIAAKSRNGVGIAGVAPNARVFPMKFLDADGAGSLSNAIEALDMAYSIEGIRVINHSWGGSGKSRALEESFEMARSRGILMVVAAGNDGANNDRKNSYPANIGLDNVISVAAIDRSERLADFSNYGKSKVHLGAPGVSILSSVLGGLNAYDSYDGTSMATPHVSGAAALVWGINPSWTYAQVRDQILQNVRPLPSLKGKTTTSGTLDLYRTIKDL